MADDLETLISIPIPANVQIRLDPPLLINGNAFPAKGTIFTMTPILIKASIPIQSVTPAASNFPNVSGAFTDISYPRQIKTKYRRMMKVPPNKPVSSKITVKILSVQATGNPVSFTTPFPKPTPVKPPLRMASVDR